VVAGGSVLFGVLCGLIEVVNRVFRWLLCSSLVFYIVARVL